MESSPRNSRTAAERVRSLLVLSLTLAVASLLVDWPRLDHSIALDPSWQRLFDVQFAAGTQSGEESIFTYGPLGALHTQIWVPHAFWWRAWLVEGLLKLVFASFIVRAGLAIPGRVSRTLAFAALLFAGLTDDSGFLLAIAAIAVVLVVRGPSRWLDTIPAAFALSLAGAMKFTFQLEGFAVATVVAIVAWARGERRATLRWLGIYGGVQLGVWLAAGQDPRNLADYLRGSLEIARGYTLAQGSGALLTDFTQPLIVFGLVVAAAALRARADRWDLRTLGVALVGLMALAMAFRAAAISTPLPTTFHESALVLPFLVLATAAEAGGTRVAWSRAAAGTALLASLAALPGSFVATHAAELGGTALVRARWKDLAGGIAGFAGLAEQRRALEEGDALARERCQLPRTVALAGGRKVDLIGFEQALAIFGGLELQGRPVAQSYSVHTPWLAERNLAALLDDSGPEVVMLRLSNIERLAGWMLEPLTFEALLERYEPRFVEWDYVVFERSGKPPAARLERPAFERALPEGEWLELPAGDERGLWLELDVPLTPRGEVYSALVRGPLPQLELEFDGGRRRTHEFAPLVARGGWRIDPWFETQYDFERWLAGYDVPRVRRLRWLRPEGGERLVEPVAHVRGLHRELLRNGAPLAPGELHPWAERKPDRVQFDGNAWTVLTDEGPALRSTASMRWEWSLPAGSHAWHARGALVGGRMQAAAGEVHLRVAVNEAGSERQLEERVLEGPRGEGQLRRFRASGILELERPAILVLEFHGGASGVIVGDTVQIASIGPREAAAKAEGELRERRPRREGRR